MAQESAVDAGLNDSFFSASWLWLKGFKKRHNLSWRSRTRMGQDTQGDGEAVLSEFASRIAGLVRDNDIDVIYNADQTGVNYEYLPTRTLNPRGDMSVWI
ncbi:unnamed protein product, partial [Aphanomyces euteiches]